MPKQPRSDEPVTPTRYPLSTPPNYPTAGHDFTLQAVMEMQKAVGGLQQAVHTLTERSTDQSKKLDSISHRIYGAAAVLAAVGAILYFFLDHMWTQIVTVLQSLPPVKP